MYCIKCESIVRPLLIDNELDLFVPNNNILTIEGVIDNIRVGYGSKYDGHKLIVSICDKCIENTLGSGTVLLLDTMFLSTKEDIEKSKKVFSRRKKLDDLELE